MSRRDLSAVLCITAHCEVFSSRFPNAQAYCEGLRWLRVMQLDFYILSVGPYFQCQIAVCQSGNTLPFTTAALPNKDPLHLYVDP